ncbi:MAG: hypothetical protein ABSF82_04970 [Candidatus Bathyarchaeia archaeon]
MNQKPKTSTTEAFFLGARDFKQLEWPGIPTLQLVESPYYYLSFSARR